MGEPLLDPDSQLMLRVKNGDLQAFDGLARKYQTVLSNFFTRMGVHSLCDDLVQETLVRIYRSRKRYRVRARFNTYLHTVARNIWIDHLRRHQRESKRLEIIGDAQRVAAQSGSSLHPPPAIENLQQALNRLPPKLRMVIVMNVYQEMSYKEIARALRIPEGTVKSRMNLAMKKLREWITP